ncbi:hypothetical protein JW926_02750 [Candidatus Sumerlaeota bacterium]|nr:hypothetical protein [Candidatus Sumerlaeota bacterium]
MLHNKKRSNQIDNIYDETNACIDGLEFIENLYEISGVVINTDSLPGYLNMYANEARYCYAHNLFIGSIALCRTMIELCLNEIYRNKNIPEVPLVEAYEKSSFDLIEYLFHDNQSTKKRLHRLRIKLNGYVHGQPKNIKEEMKKIYLETINCINEIYDANS